MPYGYASFLHGVESPRMLDRDAARAAAAAAMDMRLTYGYNAQFVTVSRRLIEELSPHGPFYQSPFPDYYSTNVAFLKARSIVLEPKPLVLIGVTPKSYGFFHVNQREEEGRAFLAGDRGTRTDPELEERVLLPGTNINVGWLLAVEQIRRNYGAELPLSVNRARFRRLQAAHVYEQRFIQHTIGDEQLADLEARLRTWERIAYRVAARTAAALRPLIPARLRRALDYLYRRSLRQFPTWNPPRLAGAYANVLEVFEGYSGAGEPLPDSPRDQVVHLGGNRLQDEHHRDVDGARADDAHDAR
jgi:hypothetical protein